MGMTIAICPCARASGGWTDGSAIVDCVHVEERRKRMERKCQWRREMSEVI